MLTSALISTELLAPGYESHNLVSTNDGQEAFDPSVRECCRSVFRRDLTGRADILHLLEDTE